MPKKILTGIAGDKPNKTIQLWLKESILTHY